MTDPLNYENPLPDDAPRERAAPREVSLPRDVQPKQVVPVELDLVLLRTSDHAGARAVQIALRREIISAAMSADDQEQAVIFIRARDLPRAQRIASEVFVRRKKLRKM
ncbi:MAG TPA: hypothetical protein VF669_16715 [Tepidisphaeraceae bacterium]|jgi:hypothetical protein